MLGDASAINGYAIEASDGLLGTVSDLLFEDVGWATRWLVVDTGNWLSGRKVLLPLSVLGKPDRALTMNRATILEIAMPMGTRGEFAGGLFRRSGQRAGALALLVSSTSCPACQKN
jgi:hypothetical protein